MDIDWDQIPDQTFLKAGTHYVECVKAEYHQSTHGDWGFELTWSALEADKRGQTMRDRLYPTWKGDPTAKMTARLKIAAGALGLLPEPGQKSSLPPEAWIGKRCWIEVVEGEPYAGRDGKMRTSFQVTFAGYDSKTPPPPGIAPPRPVPTPGAAVPPGASAPPLPAPPAGSHVRPAPIADRWA